MTRPDGADAGAYPAPEADCAAYAPLLPLLGHGTLSAADEDAGGAHLAVCARCQARRTTFERMDAGLRRYSAALEADAPDPEAIIQVAFARAGEGVDADELTPGWERAFGTRDRSGPGMDGLGMDGIVEKGIVGMETDPKRPTTIGGATANDDRHDRHVLDVYGPLATGQRPQGQARGKAIQSRPLTVPRAPARRPRALPAVAAMLIIALGGALFALLANQRHPQAHGRGQTTVGGQPTACAPGQISAPSLREAYITRIAMTSPDEGWAVGSLGNPEQSITSLILHYSHCRWVQEGPALPGMGLDSLAVVSASDAWASGSDLSGERDILLHYTGTGWLQITIPGLDTSKVGFGGIVMLSAGEGWLSAVDKQPGQARKFWTGGFLYHYQHGAWTRLDCPTVGCAPEICPQGCGPVVPAGPDEFWMIPYGVSGPPEVVHYRAGTWTTVRVPGAIMSLRFNSPTDGWGVGSAGYDPTHPQAPLRNFAMHYDGTSWTRTTVLDDARVNDTPYVTLFDLDMGWAFASSTGHSPFRAQPNFQDAAYRLSGGRWQALPWPFKDITYLQVVVPLADGECWAVATYLDTGGAHTTTGNVLLRYADGVWTAYGR